MNRTEILIRKLGSDYTTGYGLTPIPSPIDDEVGELVVILATTDARQRQTILSMMNEKFGFLFAAYGERMASLAVRDGRVDFIWSGLCGLAIASVLIYLKEVLPVVSLLFRSMELNGVDTEAVTSRILGIGSEPFDQFVAAFPARSIEDKRIDVMGYSEGRDADGFRYQRTW